jgi:integrase
MATTRPLLPDEERIIFASLTRIRDQVLFLVQRLAGFRISEALSLRVGDVWQGGAMKAEIVFNRSRLKGGRGLFKRRVRERTVPMHPHLQAALQNLILKRFGHDEPDPRVHLFIGRKSRPLGAPITRVQAYRILRAAADAAGSGQGVGTHSLRKSFAHEIYERSGHDLVLTQVVMRHTSVLTTVRYLQLNKEAATKAVMSLAGLIEFADCPIITEIPNVA